MALLAGMNLTFEDQGYCSSQNGEVNDGEVPLLIGAGSFSVKLLNLLFQLPIVNSTEFTSYPTIVKYLGTLLRDAVQRNC